MICSLAKLEDAKLKKITALEQELGKSLLAFSCYDYKPADVSQEQLSQIQGLEKELGLSLVAVQA